MSIWLVMQAANGCERRFAVQKPTIVIGRETTCDVRVPVPSVSQKHCQITLEQGQLKLIDLCSDRGTFHNGNRVQEALLVHEDTVTIGPVTFVVRVQQDAELTDGQPQEIIIERMPDLPSSRDGQRLGALDPMNDLNAG
jgi:pSer/pThr/pTyr-binding forkhead associated (FHA) protein